MNVHQCVSFLLIKDEKVLLEKRTGSRSSDPGMVNIPGGHMEQDESQEDTLIRELEEELSIKPKSYRHLCSLYHPTSELQLIHYYVVSCWHGEINALEAEEVNWFDLKEAPVEIEADKSAIAEYFRLEKTMIRS
jgi:mutator protein MutT